MILVYHTDNNIYDLLVEYEEKKKHDSEVRICAALGDSWFSIGGLTSSILIDMAKYDEQDKMLVVNFAYPGDTLEEYVAGFKSYAHFFDKRFGTTWDAVLCSLGGNDILQWLDQKNGVYPLPDWYGMYKTLYKNIVDIAGNTEMLIHGYCTIFELQYSKPFFKFWELGPWLGPRMERVYGAYPGSKEYHKVKIREFFRAFHSDLRKLEKLSGFNTLLPVRDYKEPTKFVNEIHLAPGEDGYDNIAYEFYRRLIHLKQNF